MRPSVRSICKVGRKKDTNYLIYLLTPYVLTSTHYRDWFSWRLLMSQVAVE